MVTIFEKLKDIIRDIKDDYKNSPYARTGGILIIVLMANLPLFSSLAVNNPNGLGTALLISDVTILAGILSGFGSYYGGLSGAEKNYILAKQHLQEESKQLLLNQLMFTFNVILGYDPKGKEIDFQKLIYNNDWDKHIVYCDFDNNEKKIIFVWFLKIKQLSIGNYVYRAHDVYGIKREIILDEDSSINTDLVLKIFEEYSVDIEKILKKYGMIKIL